MSSLDAFEDAPNYYSKMIETVSVTEIVEEDSRIKVSKWSS